MTDKEIHDAAQEYSKNAKELLSPRYGLYEAAVYGANLLKAELEHQAVKYEEAFKILMDEEAE
jgi:hypothetical protein